MATSEWAHVSRADGRRRISVASTRSASTSLAGGNPMLAAVDSARLDASRRAQEKQRNAQLLSQISQSPFARGSTTRTLGALASPTLVDHLVSVHTNRIGLVRGSMQSPRSPGLALSFGAHPGSAKLQAVDGSPRRRDSEASAYLAYLVGEHKKRLGEVPGGCDDADFDELPAPAARDQETATGRPFVDPPASTAPMPSAASLRPTEKVEASELALQLGPEPAATSFGGASPVVALSSSSVSALDGTLSSSQQQFASFRDMSAPRASNGLPGSVQPVAGHVASGDHSRLLIIDQVAKPACPRSPAYADISTSLPPRTASPSEVSEDEIGGQWRKQFVENVLKSTLEDEVEPQPSKSCAHEDAQETGATHNRLDKLRGGPPRVPSRGAAWVTSARAVPTHTALASERNALRRHPSADDLLRRIERHFDANGDGELDEAEISEMFDTLDEDGTGRLTQHNLRVGLEKAHLLDALDESATRRRTQQDLRAGLEKAHIYSNQNAQQNRSHASTSEDSRHFRTSAHWSGSVNAIERAIPAQFHALREGIDIDDDTAPLRPSIAQLSSTVSKMKEAMAEQGFISKQVQVRESRALATTPRELTASESFGTNSSDNSSSGVGRKNASSAGSGVTGDPPASPPARRTSRGLSLTVAASGAVRTSSGASPRTVADAVRTGQSTQQAVHAQEREERRVAEEKEEEDRRAARRATRSALESLLS